jgi:hypothetical protein
VVAAAAVVAAALSACGGDDNGGDSSEVDHAVDFATVKGLDQGITPEQAFRRLVNATPVSEYEKPGRPRGNEPGILHVCYRFEVEGGRPTDIAELCFRRNQSLGAIGVTRSSANSGGAPVPVP